VFFFSVFAAQYLFSYLG